MPPSTTVKVLPVEREDLIRCAEIMDIAFVGEPVTGSLYPAHLAQPFTQEERYRRRSKGMEKAHYEKEGKLMFKAVDRETNEILGAAIWAKPGVPIEVPGEKDEEGEQEEEEVDEKDKDTEFCPQAGRNMATALGLKRREVMKDQPHWYLSFLFIDPKAQGKGVGSALLAWGLDQADSANPPLPVVLESSPAGKPVYEKRGFETVSTIHLENVADFPFMVRPAKSA